MRVLLVEDEHRIANTIKKGLEQERWTVDVCYTGPEGLDLALAENYDVIVLDLMLPQLDGLAICTELRQKQIHTPILILTAKSQLADKVVGLNAGADDYLTKPFAFAELLARIRALVRRPAVTVSEKLLVGNLSLDPQSFEVSRDGIKIGLSHKEFALLAYLMRNAHRVLTKDQITAQVWNYDANILPNTVEVYIRNLRQKIDVPFTKHQPLIQTLRGFGYKLSDT